MEPAAAWAPCQFQLPNWSLEPAAGGLPVEYASIDMQSGTCGLQAYVPGQQQLLECYYYSAASQHSDATSEKAKISTDNSHAASVVDKVFGDFQDGTRKTKTKMHRYPACLGAVDTCYTEPRIVAIGPYYHGREHLKQAEKVKQTEEVKHAAACHCVKWSGRSLAELYEAVIPVADDARRFYDKNVMAGISVDDFRHMMFFDACFLVQYMLVRGWGHRKITDPSLHGFLSPNGIDIFHDVMLLENQLPWKVVETVMNFVPVRSIPKKFVRKMRYCMLPDRYDELLQQKPFIWYDSYRPPHLLGLLRYHIVGRSDDNKPPTPKTKNIIFAKIGIKLTANKTNALTDMRLQQEGTIFPKLSLAPLSLDIDRASYLVNMAALEICTAESFGNSPDEDSAVSSYLTLLAMLVCREEDVHQLRENDLLEGGGGLTNEEALRFFTSLQGMRLGKCYTRIMLQIARYKEDRRVRAWLHEFFYNYWKIILTVVTAIGTVVGIIVPLLSIKRG